jgi:hypothetical protein
MGNGKVTQWAALTASLLFMGAAFVLAYQGYFWLKFGFWVPMPAVRTIEALGLNIRGWQATIEWHWVTKIVEWLLDAATTGWLVILGIGILWSAVFIDS